MNKQEIEKRFNKNFVRDNGDNIEDSFYDPNGQVGPVKDFIFNEIIPEVLKSVLMPDISKKLKEEERSSFLLLRKASSEYIIVMAKELYNIDLK